MSRLKSGTNTWSPPTGWGGKAKRRTPIARDPAPSSLSPASLRGPRQPRPFLHVHRPPPGPLLAAWPWRLWSPHVGAPPASRDAASAPVPRRARPAAEPLPRGAAAGHVREAPGARGPASRAARGPGRLPLAGGTVPSVRALGRAAASSRPGLPPGGLPGYTGRACGVGVGPRGTRPDAAAHGIPDTSVPSDLGPPPRCPP